MSEKENEMKKIMRVNVGLVAVVSTLVAMPVLAINATGGAVGNSGTYRSHTFTSNGVFTVTGEGSVEILVVAGGGGGGGAMGGGGGAGGVLVVSNYFLPIGEYEVVVGSGGIGGMAYSQAGQAGSRGENSSFGTELVAIGGGGGAGWTGHLSTSGGSGGGGNHSVAAAAGTPGQGHAGARGDNTTNMRSGGGGGGAGEPGSEGEAGVGGKGGDGIAFAGSYYGGGGGGGLEERTGVVSSSGGGIGGLGGGGYGSMGKIRAEDGAPNTGGGGGGAGYNGNATGQMGGDGGSGIVVVRYRLIGNGGGASSVTATSARLNGELFFTDSVNTEVAVFWGATDNWGSADGWDGSEQWSVDEPGLFFTNVTGLLPDTTYYYCFAVVTDSGLVWAERSETFITGEVWLEAVADASEIGLVSGTVMVHRAASAVAEPLTVNYSVGGTATMGEDYIALSGTVVIPAGETSAMIEIVPLPDHLEEGVESVVLTLGSGSYAVGDESQVTVEIEDLGQVTVVWSGAGSSELASNPDNWVDGVVPLRGAAVVLNETSDKDMRWDLDVALLSWSQSAAYSGVVTIATCYGTVGFTNLVISGACDLLGGEWRQVVNPTGQEMVYRLRVSVGGDFTLGADARINLDAQGFAIRCGPGAPTASGTAASYGGRAGIYAVGHVPKPCYGSITRPYHLGSGGYGGVYGTAGGGALWLEVAGKLTVNGEISASAAGGFEWYTGSGGSVFCRAGALEGNGAIRANGGPVTKGGGGGGGRIALVVTGAAADFDDWHGTVEALGSSVGNVSSPGTIYLERPGDRPCEGELVVVGSGTAQSDHRFGTEIGGLEPETNAFSRLTLLSSAVRLVVNSGSLLDLSQCQIDGTALGVNEIAVREGATVRLGENPVWTNCILRMDDATASLEFGGETLTIGDQGTLCIDKPFVCAEDMVVAAGGKVTHTRLGTDERFRLDLSVLGDLTIAEGGAIDVKGLGFAARTGPGAAVGNTAGGSHGGHGSHNTAATLGFGPYGSIYCPTNAGSGGGGGYGGGIVKLSVAGVLRNEGRIDADGADISHYSGAGGSIWLEAGTLAGEGTITAHGGAVTGFTPGGGGRIAITVTNVGAVVDDFAGVITASGGALGSSNKDRIGGAGTIYLRDAGVGLEAGRLIVDNSGMVSANRWTSIVPEVAERNFGAVILRNGGFMRLAEGEAIAVSEGFINESGRLLAEAGSRVSLVGTNMVIDGELAFQELVCEEPDAVVTFGSDAVVAIGADGLFKMIGAPGALITLLLAGATEWGLELDVTSIQEIAYVAVSNSNASLGQKAVAQDSIDLGGNSNWQFVTIVPGEEIIWSGVADSNWGNLDNWNRGRAPVPTDRVVIAAGVPNMPVLQSVVEQQSITIAAGATLELGGYDLTVEENLQVAGVVQAMGEETVTIKGDASFGGASFVAARSRIMVGGDGAQSIDFGSGSYYEIRVNKAGGSLVVNGGLRATILQVEAGSGSVSEVNFAAGKKIGLQRLIVNGNRDLQNIVLQSGFSGVPWLLEVVQYSLVSGASVSDSDASGGLTVIATDTVDGGGNSNWNFVAALGLWSGAGDNESFHDGDNWLGGVAPGSESTVVLDGAAVVTISEPLELHSLVIGGGTEEVQLNVNAAVTVSSSVLVEDNGVLVLNRPMRAEKGFVVGPGGLVTHDGNASEEINKINLTVGGDMEIAEGGVIDVRRKGYGKGQGPGAINVNGYAPSHGGRGRNLKSSDGQLCYGSIASPTNCSSGSYHDVGSGAVKLNVAGVLHHYGMINADGQGGYGGLTLPEHYSGAGGSIWITAGDLVGSGDITATGGNYLINNPGGGGRIALILTGAESFDNFSGRVVAHGGKNVSSPNDVAPASGAGTIYWRKAVERDIKGVVTVSNSGGRDVNINTTDIPPALHCDEREFRGFTFEVSEGATLRLQGDATVGDVQILDNTARLNLNGYTLTIRSREHSFPAGTVVNYGAIIWDPVPAGTVFMLR